MNPSDIMFKEDISTFDLHSYFDSNVIYPFEIKSHIFDTSFTSIPARNELNCQEDNYSFINKDEI